MKPTRILNPPAATMGLLILLAPSLQAGECMRLCNLEFLKTATASALQTEIDKGADMNGRDDNLNTPLHFTSFWSNARAMRALLASGADPNINTESGLTLLHLAANAQTVKLALQAWLDIHARARNGQTPLHVASCWGHADTIFALLEAGARTDMRDNNGRTAFDLANRNSRIKHTSILQQLR